MSREIGGENRVVAICTECGTAHAAVVCANNRIRPIGTDDCPCGSQNFKIMD